MSTNTYKEALNRARQLSTDELLLLMQELTALVRQQITIKEEPLHSFLELEGLGKEVWEGIDAQEYVNQERDSWNG
ncbi:MAG TPA: hypothetical protein VN954_03545 [Ktedonobacteraceae bacterium]|nr:hypothetical protein [Ktedonobacteraceae bacterium]